MALAVIVPASPIDWVQLDRAGPPAQATKVFALQAPQLRSAPGSRRFDHLGSRPRWRLTAGLASLAVAGAGARQLQLRASSGRPSGRQSQEMRRRPVYKDELISPVQDYWEKYDILYGVYPVLNALRVNERKFLKLFVQEAKTGDLDPKDRLAREEILRLSEELGVEVVQAGRYKLDQQCGERPHQGFLLRCKRRVPEVLRRLPTPTPGALWVVLQHVTDTGNVGAVMRSAAFFGVAGMVTETRSARLSPTAVKASVGASEYVPLHGSSDLYELLENAKADGWHVIGTSSRDGISRVEVVSLDEMARQIVSDRESGDSRGVVLVLGAEGPGLSTEIAQACSGLVRIDGGFEAVSSLNVSVAAGVCLHSLRSALGPGAPPACVAGRGASSTTPASPGEELRRSDCDAGDCAERTGEAELEKAQVAGLP